MISCKEATHLSSKKEEGKLTRMQRWELAFHLFICKNCKAFVRNSNFLNISFQRSEKAELTEAEKKAMQEKVNQSGLK